MSPVCNKIIYKAVSLFCALIFSGFQYTFAQIITPFAGMADSTGFSGDGGSATVAKLNHLWQLAVDNKGGGYISDASNNRIRRVDACGIIHTIAGSDSAGYNGDGIPATAAWLNEPYGVAVDNERQIVYVTDYQNYRIRKINASGIITTIAGNGIYGTSGDGGPATLAELGTLGHIAVDPAHNVYFTDAGSGTVTFRIRKIDTNGIITTFAGNGTTGFSGDGGPASAAQLHNNSLGIAFDKNGNCYISDGANNRIRKVDTAGIISTICGSTSGFSGDGGPALSAQITNAWGICVDNSGNITFSDCYNYRIRQINSSGIINSIAGNGVAAESGDGGPATAASFYLPDDVTVNSSGNIFVGSGIYNYVRVFGPILNHPPVFTADSITGLTVNACENDIADSLNSLLAIRDSDAGQTVTWNVLTPPLHGTATGYFSATILDTAYTPAGLYYRPTAGYTGPDSMRITATDCKGGADTATIHITIKPQPLAGAINGNDTVCQGKSIQLSDTSSGSWSSSNIAIGTVSGAGLVTGIAPGHDTICYTVYGVNGCTAKSSKPVVVLPHAICATGVAAGPSSGTQDILNISPNPNTGQFIVTFSKWLPGSKAQITVTNLLGQTVKEITVNEPSNGISLSIPKGIYVITGQTESGLYYARLLVQ